MEAGVITAAAQALAMQKAVKAVANLNSCMVKEVLIGPRGCRLRGVGDNARLLSFFISEELRMFGSFKHEARSHCRMPGFQIL
jgi:hypothetical protein